MPSAPVVRPGIARGVASWLPPVSSFPPGRSGTPPARRFAYCQESCLFAPSSPGPAPRDVAASRRTRGTRSLSPHTSVWRAPSGRRRPSACARKRSPAPAVASHRDLRRQTQPLGVFKQVPALDGPVALRRLGGGGVRAMAALPSPASLRPWGTRRVCQAHSQARASQAR